MVLFKKNERQNLIQIIYTKTHQIASFKKNSQRGMPPNDSRTKPT